MIGFPKSPQKQGELLVMVSSFIEAWFPIALFYLANQLGGIHAFFYNTLIATVLILGYVFWRGKLQQLKNRLAYPALLKTSLIMTVLYIFVFIGAQYTSASHVALILFLQLLFAYLYFQHTQNETLNPTHLMGAILMAFGGLLVLFPDDWQLNVGDGLVLLAAMIAPIGNYYQKQSRLFVSSETVLLARGLIALPLVLVLAILMEPIPSWAMIHEQLFWLLFCGIFVFAVAKIFWIESLHRLSITKVNALYAVSPLLTVLFAYWLLNEVPTIWQAIGAIPIVIGGVLITRPAITITIAK